MSPLKGRSVCFHCNRTLEWFDMVPVFSFLFLGGKCRTCKAKLSPQYLLVEIVTGLVFVGVFLRQYNLWPLYGAMQHGLLYSVLFFFYYAVVFSILIIITLYDMKHKIIPDGLAYSFIILSVGKLLLFLSIQGLPVTMTNVFNLLAPLLLSVPFALLWYFSSGTWIGFGDVKLVFGIGALLGLVCGLSAVVLAFWLGTLWILFVWLRNNISLKSAGGKKIGWHTEIPMAPFLVLAVFLVFLWHFDFFGLSLFLK
jgi:prepilin signal peptidase PulO-like enzyme (type II secretory pathway)